MPEQQRRRYALVGAGARSRLYTTGIATTHRQRGKLVGLCDTNRTRMAHTVRNLATLSNDSAPVCCTPDEFGSMLRDEDVDEVIVTSVDCTHHIYIIAALEAGCDVISEKPLTVDGEKCAAVLAAEQRTGKRLRVTFNYRFAPRNAKFAELLRKGAVGTPTSLHFEWLLDTVHGADYFRRWHRDKANSGGLLVHKASHHFDLVNWWLRSVPSTVFAFGDLRFYGRDNAAERGVTDFYERGTGHSAKDPFALDLTKDPEMAALYFEAEHEDGYLRDRNVFSDGITIEDDMAVLVRYDSGATMSYHLIAYAPWEGYRVAVNGTEGRLELDVEERSYVSGSELGGRGVGRTSLVLRRQWEKPSQIEVPEAGDTGHGGADSRLLDYILAGAEGDELGRGAGSADGAWALLTGAAGNQSMATGLPVRPRELLLPAAELASPWTTPSRRSKDRGQ